MHIVFKPAGKRIVALDDDTIKILNDWKSRQTEIGLGKENDFVFSYDGLPMIKSTISRIIERYSKFAEVKKCIHFTTDTLSQTTHLTTLLFLCTLLLSLLQHHPSLLL